MFIYEKRLIFPVKIKKPDVRVAKYIATLYGGANGEITASLSYLNQRYYMDDKIVSGILTDIGTEELSHVEMLGAMLTACLKNASRDEIIKHGLDSWYVNHGTAPFLADSDGYLWNAAYVGTTGDPIADITNNMAAEQKARAGYEAVLRLTDDPDIIAPLRFLREREIVHFQRFGEALNRLQG
ncbi:MAG: manganese catalase family protein [Clostridiales bacterium]|nr:manganese catalase family protein [Clostridiales bacterium]